MAKANKKTTKKKNGSSTVIALVIIFLCLVAVFVGVTLKIKQNSEEPVDQGLILLERDLEKDYPESPLAVMKYYYDISKYLYSGTNDITLTSDLIWQQRLMFTRELQVLNPYEVQKEKALEEIVQLQTNGVNMISVEISDARLDPENTTIAYITVTEYWTNSNNMTKEYALYLEDGKWKIHRLEIIGKE